MGWIILILFVAWIITFIPFGKIKNNHKQSKNYIEYKSTDIKGVIDEVAKIEKVKTEQNSKIAKLFQSKIGEKK
jgi:hypothetical protein